MPTEIRTIPQKFGELRVLPGEGLGTLTGSFAVFNRYSRNLGGFVEQIDPGAFTATMRSGADVLSTFSHDTTKILGRASAGNLHLSADATAATYTVQLRDNATARELVDYVSAGFVLGSSFMFEVDNTADAPGDAWSRTDQGYPLRTLMRVRLAEVGPTAMPAYQDTERVGTVALRSLAQATGVALDEVVAVARANRLGDILPGGERTPSSDARPGEPAGSRNDKARRRLRVLEAAAR